MHNTITEQQKYDTIYRRHENYNAFRYSIRKDYLLYPSIPFYILLHTLITGDSKRVLDVGCGKGNFGRVIHSLNPKHHLAGIDISTTAVEEARRHGVYSELHSGDFLSHPIGSNPFDVLLLLDGLEHFDREVEGAAIERALLSLSVGGYAFFSISTAEDRINDRVAKKLGYRAGLHVNVKPPFEWDRTFQGVLSDLSNRMNHTFVIYLSDVDILDGILYLVVERKC